MGDKWDEIGRISPQKPQMFYNVTTPDMEIRWGDILVSNWHIETKVYLTLIDLKVRIFPESKLMLPLPVVAPCPAKHGRTK